MNLKFAVLLSGAVAIASALPAHALVTSTKAITCSATTKLQAAIDAVPPGTEATINVSGTCNENITVPVGKSVNIVGATATAKIIAANALLPTVMVTGEARLKKMIVSNPAGAAEALVETQSSGALYVISSDLTAPAAEYVVGAWSGEVNISNSRVMGGIYGAIDVWGNTLLKVHGGPLDPVGPTGRYESYVKSPGNGINCWHGTSLRIVAKSKGTSMGMVTIEQSATGITGNHCSISISNYTSDRARLRIRNNQIGMNLQQSQVIIENATVASNTGGPGIQLLQGDLVLAKSLVSGNKMGVTADQSHIRIEASTFVNSNGDVQAANDTHLQLTSWSGASSFSKALLWQKSFDCWSGGRIDVDAGSVTPALGTHYNFLDCIFVH